MTAGRPAITRISPWRLVGTLGALGLLVYLLSQQGWDEILDAVRQIDLWRLALAMGIMLVSRLAVSARWHALLRGAGLRITAADTTRITFAGLFASNFLPTTIGGDVVRLAGIVQHKYDGAVCTASLVVDRLVGMAGMAMLIPLGLPALLAHSTALQMRLHSQSSAAPPTAFLLSRRLRKYWDKILDLGKRLLSALSIWVQQPRALAAALGATWVHMLCLFSILAILFGGMGSHISIWLIGGLYSIVYFVTLLPVSINGYGLQELSMTLIFSEVAGVPLAHALTGALLFRTIMMIASLPGALFVAAMLPGGATPEEIPEPGAFLSAQQPGSDQPESPISGEDPQ